MIEDISRGSKSAEESVIKINNLKADTEEISNVITKLGYNLTKLVRLLK